MVQSINGCGSKYGRGVICVKTLIYTMRLVELGKMVDFTHFALSPTLGAKSRDFAARVKSHTPNVATWPVCSETRSDSGCSREQRRANTSVGSSLPLHGPTEILTKILQHENIL